jgi:L-rhamnose-H+ transport protein
VPNPLLGVLFHWLGGLASASFYVPYKRIRGWSWEIFWLTGGIISWLVAPWLFAYARTEDLFGVLGATPRGTLMWCWLWGVLWGFGGLTFGLTMRYLGLSLGMAVVLGLTMVIGTLGPPIFHGQILEILSTVHGVTIVFGIALALAGVLVVAQAGRMKESESRTTEAASAIAEFDFKKGVLVALFSGVMSSCFAFGLDAGAPIRELTLAAGTPALSQGLPVLCVVLAGGLTTNLVWCLGLISRNHSAGEFIGRAGMMSAEGGKKPSLLVNYLLAALGGTAWYFQFFFYTMGESQMGRYGFSSWTLHMASIILFSSLWGIALKEWVGSGPRVRRRMWLGILMLVAATCVIGFGNHLATLAD